MAPELLAAAATILAAVLLFAGTLITIRFSAKHNRLENENKVKDLQIKMIDQLQEERTHTENLLKEERELRVKEIAAINDRFEKYKDEVRASKAIDREYINNLEHHINAGEPPPPPAPPPGYKP